jgi:L-asparaginase
VIPLVNIDSRDMTPELWLRLARLVNETLADPGIAGVVVTHGTDTMEDTAYVLELTVASDKPVVLTGAQRDASTPDADGPRNLLNAVRQVIDADAGGRGVTITFDSQIFYARLVTKCHTNHVSAFAAGHYGQAGELDDEQVTWFGRPERGPRFSIPSQLPNVDLVYVYPGADGSLIDSAVEHGAQGIVVCGYGIGNVNLPVFEAIERARESRVQVVLTTRVAEGRVYPVYGGEGGGTSMKKLGVVFGEDLLPWKARILLMLALTVTDDPAEIQGYFGR